MQKICSIRHFKVEQSKSVLCKIVGSLFLGGKGIAMCHLSDNVAVGIPQNLSMMGFCAFVQKKYPHFSDLSRIYLKYALRFPPSFGENAKEFS